MSGASNWVTLLIQCRKKSVQGLLNFRSFWYNPFFGKRDSSTSGPGQP